MFLLRCSDCSDGSDCSDVRGCAEVAISDLRQSPTSEEVISAKFAFSDLAVNLTRLAIVDVGAGGRPIAGNRYTPVISQERKLTISSSSQKLRQ